jgi:hypothetical protein
MQPTDRGGYATDHIQQSHVAQQPVAQQPVAQQPVAQQLYGQPAQVVVGGQPSVMAGTPGMLGAAFPATSAVAALVLSILGIVGCGCCTAIPGLIIANNALVITNQYPGHPDAGMAKAAQIIGWIVVGLAIAFILFYVIVGGGLLAMGIASESTGG